MENLIQYVPLSTAIFLFALALTMNVTKNSGYLIGVVIFKWIPFTLGVLNLIIAGKLNGWW
jgi:hypothetical protein